MSDEAVAALAHGERIAVHRLAWLVLSATELSEQGYVLIRWSGRISTQRHYMQWRVNVRWHGHEHVATATPDTEQVDRAPALLLALDRAVQWLRACHARHRLSPSAEPA